MCFQQMMSAVNMAGSGSGCTKEPLVMEEDANGVTGDTLNSDLGKQDDTLHCTTAASRVVRLDAYVPL